MRRARRYSRGPDGFVLVCVLWVLAILTVLTLGFGRRAFLDARAAALSLDQAQAQYMARGAVQRGIAQVRLNQRLQEALDTARETSRGRRVPWQLAPHDTRSAIRRIPRLKPPREIDLSEWCLREDKEAFANDVCKCVIEDEESRICINAVSEELLDEIEGLSFRAESAILRRIEEASEGEDNAPPFVVLEELLSLRGIDEEDLSGDGETPGFRDLFTVYGDGLINVNTASRDVLECIPDLDSDLIEDIVLYRAGEDGELGTKDDRAFRSIEEIAAELAVSAERLTPLGSYCKTESRFLRISGFATRRQGRVKAACSAVVMIDDANVTTVDWKEGLRDS